MDTKVGESLNFWKIEEGNVGPAGGSQIVTLSEIWAIKAKELGMCN